MFNEVMSNPVNTWAKRADIIFQMHIPTIWRNPLNRNDPKHYDWLKSQSEIVVMMQDVYADVPMSTKYPLDEIKAMLGDGAKFLTSSVAQALALAAYVDKFDRVEVYGVAMETNTEYGFQREGVAFWLGFLNGRGIDVYFADKTFEAPIYGYEGEVFIKYERFAERLAILEPERDKLTGEYNAASVIIRGALDNFYQSSDDKTEQALYDAVFALRTSAERLGFLDGAIQENKRYQHRADEMLGVDNNFVFSRQEFESGAARMQKLGEDENTNCISLGTQLEIVHRNIKQAAKGSPKRTKLMESYRHILAAYIRAVNKVMLHKGAAQENLTYMNYLDRHIQAAGGSKSVEAIMAQVQNA